MLVLVNLILYSCYLFDLSWFVRLPPFRSKRVQDEKLSLSKFYGLEEMPGSPSCLPAPKLRA